MADRYGDRALERHVPTSAPPSEAMDELVKEARARVEENIAATTKFRKQRKADREFIEYQFQDDDEEERKKARKPSLQVHLINERVQEVMRRYRESGIGFRVASATSETGDDAAKAFNGLAQRDQRDSLSEAQLERIVQEAVYYGEGWGTWDAVDEDGMLASGVLRYDNGRTQIVAEAGLGMFDRRLRLRSCDAERIYEDPTDDTPDRSQMNWLIETEQITHEQRDARYPRAKKLPLSVFDAGDSWFPEYQTDEGPKRDRLVVVARYYRKRIEKVEFVWHPTFGDKALRADRLSAEQRTLSEADPGTFRTTKDVPILELIVTDGMYVLEGPTVLPYERIPYFRAVSTEERIEDGERLKRGVVYRLRDMAAAMSVGLSDAFWKVAIQGVPAWLVAADTLAAYPGDWRDTTIPKSVRQFDAFARYPGGDGRPLPLPAPQYVSPSPDLSSTMEMLAATKDMIGASAGSADPVQRDTTAQHRSAVALDRMDRMAAAGHSLPLWNAEHILMAAVGEIWRGMAPFIYDRVGRIVRVAGESPSHPDEGWIIGVPFIRHPSTGQPLPVQVPDDQTDYPLQGTGDPQNGTPDRTTKIHRFNPARDVVKVETFAQSLNAAGADAYAEVLLEAAPAVPEFAPVLLKGALRAMADRFPVQAVLKELDALSPPPADTSSTDIMALPAQMRAIQAQLQQVTAERDQLRQAADQTAAAREIAAGKDQTALTIAREKAQTDIQKTRIVTEQREDAAVLAAASKVDSERDAAEVTAFVKGLESAKGGGAAPAE